MGKKDRPFNNPFADLGPELKKRVTKELRAKKKATPAAAERAAKAAPAPKTDEDLFRNAVAGAEPIRDHRGTVRPPPPRKVEDLPVRDEDAEVLAELASLVEGTGRFDISDSDEFIEGCIEGLDRRILGRLKRGDYAHRGHLDLHGLNRAEARSAVDRFIADKRSAGHRCVLIVHGRGKNSKDQIPVLKSALKVWLERGRIARSVLAFCTARPHDGGAGAVYVLLRR